MNESIRDLETRVRRLERRNRGLMIACMALAGLPMLLAAAAQDQPKPKLPPGNPPITQAQAPDGAKIYISKELQDMLKADKAVHNVLRARVIALVDKDGNTKALLSTDEQGHPMLSMFGAAGGGKPGHLALTMGVVSNKPVEPSRRILDGLGLLSYFHLVLGGESLPERKPDPGPLLHACASLGARPARSVMVGDSAIDAEAARAACVPLVLVAWGFLGREELLSLRPDFFAEDPASLATWILRGG